MSATICRHIKPNGERCGSPALRNKPRCYFHDHGYLQVRRRKQQLREAAANAAIIHPLNPGPDGLQRNPLVAEYLKPVPEPLDFPPLEDRPSIQIALSTLIRALARGEVDPQRAGQMLYGLQVASANAKGFSSGPWEEAVEEVILDDEGNELAPDEDPNCFLKHLRELEEDEEYED